MLKDNYICIGKILRPHGVKGLVKLISYTENFPELLYIENSEEPLRIKLLSKAGEIWLAQIGKVDSRNLAENYKNTLLYKPKETLTNQDEYYIYDLINCEVIDENSSLIGNVKNIYNFGAGNILEIDPGKGQASLMLAFNNNFVKSIDLESKKIFVIKPEVF